MQWNFKKKEQNIDKKNSHWEFLFDTCKNILLFETQETNTEYECTSTYGTVSEA